MGRKSHITDRDPRPTLTRTLATAIGRQIVGGTIPPDSVLSATTLSKFYGVSPHAMHRTLAILDFKGLTITWPQVGSRVNHWDRWHLLDPDVLQWAPEGGWLAQSAARLRAALSTATVDFTEPDPIMYHLALHLQRFAEEKV